MATASPQGVAAAQDGVPAKQTAFRLAHSPRGPHDLQVLHDEDTPRLLGPSDVLVRIRAASLNFRDLMLARGDYPFPHRQGTVPCSDGAGDVVAVGPAVPAARLGRGDVVVVAFDPNTLHGPMRDVEEGGGLAGNQDGVLRQYVVMPASAVVKVPKGSMLTYEQWATLPCAGVTAWNAIFGGVPMKPGQTILFQGTGGVSIIGLIVAKAAGAITIITSSSDEKLKLVKERFGADHTINYRTTPNWSDEVLKLTGGEGVDLVLENGGPSTMVQSLASLQRGGTISIVGFLAVKASPSSEMPDLRTLFHAKAATMRGINVGSVEHLEQLVHFVGRRGLEMPVDRTFGFSRDEVVAAYEYLSSGKHVGKVCIRVE
ncbi:hypothetical protein HK405_002140 [Cladochytrium tenue]|nr:hypothetical protein HK405_002140 [Cladochytrium tenue]